MKKSISFILLLLASQVFAQTKSVSLCSKDKQEELYNLLVEASLDEYGMKAPEDMKADQKNIFFYSWRDDKGRSYFVHLIDSTKEIHIVDCTFGKNSDTISVTINANGAIENAFVRRCRTCNRDKIFDDSYSSNTDVHPEDFIIYINQLVYQCYKMGVDYGTAKGRRGEENYALSKIKLQEHYPCERSRMGKLVTKPLKEDTVIHYKKALREPVSFVEQKRRESKPGDFTTLSFSLADKNKSPGIIRYHVWNKDSVVTLSAYPSSTGESCYYSLNFKNKKKHEVLLIYFDSNGEVNSEESRVRYDDKSKADKDQKRVDELLKYFE